MAAGEFGDGEAGLREVVPDVGAHEAEQDLAGAGVGRHGGAKAAQGHGEYVEGSETGVLALLGVELEELAEVAGEQAHGGREGIDAVGEAVGDLLGPQGKRVAREL